VNFLFLLLTSFSYPLELLLNFILISDFRILYLTILIQGLKLCLKISKLKEWVHVLVKIRFCQ